MRRQTITCNVYELARKLYLSGLFVVMFGMTSNAMAKTWHHIAPGIEYHDFGKNKLSPWSHIHVFRINLKKNKFDLMTATDISSPHASADEFAQQSHALIALNAGFFDRNYHPLGLRIGHQHRYTPLKQISWWGVFFIKNNIPSITNAQQFKEDRNIHFAVQSGPRLIIEGNIPSLKPGYAERSALGITHDGHVIVLVTENMVMTTTMLATLMKSSQINCRSALNLDGGSSSQLTANIGSFHINAHGFSNVSDAILISGL